MRKTAFIFCVLLFYMSFLRGSIAKAQSYFQQKSDYLINVRLNDSLHLLQADQTIVYYNRSPDTLHEIFMHLWPNATSSHKTALAEQKNKSGNAELYFAGEDETGYIKGIQFQVNGEFVRWEYTGKSKDVAVIFLKSLLPPGDSVIIYTPFTVKIPSAGLTRMGHKEQAYHIPQWYPKPAVYDRTGWHPYPYLDDGEFYSEFGSFDVTITIPENYTVAATGVLISGDAYNSVFDTSTATPAKQRGKKSGNDIPPSSKKMKTLRFYQDKVHDFAWFADKRFVVKSDSIELSDQNTRVKTYVYYVPSQCPSCDSAIHYVNTALKYYSSVAGNYPYASATAVYSFEGGMEYPMITVIGSSKRVSSLEEVTIHEVGHNWFYGILANDERKNPWMDEGLTTYLTMKLLDSLHPGRKLPDVSKIPVISSLTGLKDAPAMDLLYYYSLIPALRKTDQAAGLSSEQYSSFNYGALVYAKAALGFRLLNAYLGDSVFNRSLQNYYNEWAFRHPGPDDLRIAFEKSSRKNLDWFFTDFLLYPGSPDYAVQRSRKAKLNDSIHILRIKNKGTRALPFLIGSYAGDSLINSQWQEGFTGKKDILINSGKSDKIIIDREGMLPEISRINNSIRGSGLFRKFRPLVPRLLWSLPRKESHSLFFLPAAGWNHYDGLMAGVALYSDPVFVRSLDYMAIPLYGFSSDKLCGYGEAGYSFRSRGTIVQWLRLFVSGKQYSTNNGPLFRFNKLEAGGEIRFADRNPSGSVRKYLRIRTAKITYDHLEYSEIAPHTAKKETRNYTVTELLLSFKTTKAVNPAGFDLTLRSGNGFLNASANAKARISYSRKNKGLDIRFFFGGFIIDDGKHREDMRFRLSGDAPWQDYMFDGTYPGRFELSGIWSQQFEENGGGFVISTPYGQTWKWLGALNLRASLPGRIPLSVYANFGTFSEVPAKPTTAFSEKILYEAGAVVPLIRNVFEIYFPALLSRDLKKVDQLSEKKYIEKIRFTLRLNSLNLHRFLREQPR